MELTYLIENYSYLKFIVDVYDEYSKKHEISDDIMFRKIKSKYEEAKTFLSFIETAITMLPINKRSNYNNQYEVVYRKSYIEKMKIKAISDLLNTSIRNAYSIRQHALNMIEKRFDLFFDYRFRIEKVDAPQKYPVLEVFNRCSEAETMDYYSVIVRMIQTEIGVIEGNFAYAMLNYPSRRLVCRYMRSNYPSLTQSAYRTYYKKVKNYIGVCLYGFDYLSSQKGYLISEKDRKGDSA